MTRVSVMFDRVAATLLGVALVALAALTVAWQRGVLGGGRPLRGVGADVTAAAWWPWASAAVGVVLVVLGVRWLAVHGWAPKASRIAVDPSDSALSADAAAAARAAADRLSRHPSVMKAAGAATVERGRPTISLTVTVPARRGLRTVAEEVDDVARTLSAMLGDVVAVRSIVRIKSTKHATVR